MQPPNSELLWTLASPVPSGVGGWFFAVDPTLSASEAAVFWLAEARPGVVSLAATPLEADALTFEPSQWPSLRARRRTSDGEHLLLGTGGEEHQLWLPDPVAEGQPLAAVIPLDEFAPLRAEAVLRFLRHVGSRKSSPPNKPNPRTAIMLRALDGHLDGCSYRSIAEGLFGRSRVVSEPWKTSSIRDATIRLVRGGLALMRGGYRRLLSK